MGGPSRPLMKPRWLGGPIEARGLDEIVDFMVAIFIKQLCYQLHGWHGIPCWMAIFKGKTDWRRIAGHLKHRENLRASCNFWWSILSTNRAG